MARDQQTYFRCSTLNDLVTRLPLTVDGVFNDGWGAPVVLKGVELEAAVLFADIRSFTERSKDLTPVETLAFVNNFFTWITAEAIADSKGVVDKYIGDEVMMVFAKELGSEDPFADALLLAAKICQKDVLDYSPRIGIAQGPIVVGHVGTPVHFDCSVFGRVVALARRCAAVDPEEPIGHSIAFPSSCWKYPDIQQVVPTEKYRDADGKIVEQLYKWSLSDAREIDIRGFGQTRIREIRNSYFRMNSFSIEEIAKGRVKELKESRHYRPTLSSASNRK